MLAKRGLGLRRELASLLGLGSGALEVAPQEAAPRFCQIALYSGFGIEIPDYSTLCRRSRLLRKKLRIRHHHRRISLSKPRALNPKRSGNEVK